jgi:hypothetical protein
VWHENGTREAFLMHVTAVLDAIKKCGHFLEYKKAEKAQDEAKKAIESARAGLSLLNSTMQSQEGFARRRQKKPPRKLLQRPKTPSQKPRKPWKRPR